MDNEQRVRGVMVAMSPGRVGPLFEAMAEDVTWHWMGVNGWSRTFEGKQTVVDNLVGEPPRHSAHRAASRCTASTLTATALWWSTRDATKNARWPPV
jgi:hypothetical protein